MNARFRLYSIVLFVTLALSACAPAAAPTTVAQEPAKPRQSLSEPQAPQPAATQAPAASPAQPVTSAEGNTFQNPGINPETGTRRDHLSTFGLDVDTASYSVARRYINDGSLPPADAVRVEEFINSFDQGYDAPAEAAFTIYADGAPSPFDPEGGYLMRVGIQGYRVSERNRKPLNLVFVVDTSGSMRMENRLELVKDSLNLLVKRLDEADRVAIVAYQTEAWVVLDPTSGDRGREIMRSLDRLEPGGVTNAEAGLREGYRLAMQMYRQDSVNRVVLCTDGVANSGETSPEGLLEMVGGYIDEGVTLTAVGFGMGNFNDSLLEQLADKGNGNYSYVDTLDEARELFVENLVATMQVIAMDAKVQVDFNSDVVASYRLLGYENRAIADQDFRDDQTDAGEIGAGHSATALYALQLRPGVEGRIATVQLRWKDPETLESQEINGNVNTWSLSSQFAETSARFQLAATVAQFAEVLRNSPYAYGVSLDDLAERADQLAGQLGEDEQVSELAGLIDRAARLAW